MSFSAIIFFTFLNVIHIFLVRSRSVLLVFSSFSELDVLDAVASLMCMWEEVNIMTSYSPLFKLFCPIESCFTWENTEDIIHLLLGAGKSLKLIATLVQKIISEFSIFPFSVNKIHNRSCGKDLQLFLSNPPTYSIFTHLMSENFGRVTVSPGCHSIFL